MKAASVKTIIYMNYIVGEMMHKPNCTTCTYLQSTEVSKQFFLPLALSLVEAVSCKYINV